jgi:hypothetical protein
LTILYLWIVFPYLEEIEKLHYLYIVDHYSVPPEWIHNNLWRWLGIPTFLALVGTLWWGHGRRVLLLILLALPVPLTYLLVTSDWAIHKHSVYPLVFLAPAAGWGIVKTGERYRGPGWLNLEPILLVGLAALLLLHGFREMRYLDQMHPSFREVTTYLMKNLEPRDVIMADGEHVLRYLLRHHLPPENILATRWTWHEGQGGTEGSRRAVVAGRPTFIVQDEYYGPPKHREALLTAMHDMYRLAHAYEEDTSLGPKTVWIYHRVVPSDKERSRQ